MASQVAFPESLRPGVDYSLPAGVSSTAIKVVPSNVSSIVSPTTTLTAGTGIVAVQCNGANANVIFDIPTGGSKSLFLDPRFTLLNFRVKYAVANAAGASISKATLRSSALAHFDRMYIQSGGVVLEDINLYGVIADQLNALELSQGDLDSLSTMYGFRAESDTDLNAYQGHKIAGLDAQTITGAVNNYYSYSVPILSSLLGKGSHKMLQTGALSNLQLVLQTAAILPVTIMPGAVATTAADFTCTIDNISLSMQQVDIGMEGVKMLDKTGVQYYSGITYRASTATLPAGTSGSVSLLTGLRGSSVRGIWTRCTQGGVLDASGCLNFVYDSKLFQATSAQYNINGINYPPNPIDLIHAPATAFAALQESNSHFNNYDFKSTITPLRYCAYVLGGTLANDADARITAGLSSADNLCSFAYGCNLEKVSKAGIMDGLNANQANVYFNAVLANGADRVLTFIFIAKQDVIYVHDTTTGQISVRL
jgi:hypothetical protein